MGEDRLANNLSDYSDGLPSKIGHQRT